MLESTNQSLNETVKNVQVKIEDLAKTYDVLKAETKGETAVRFQEFDHKLGTELQMAKKEILTQLDNKVNEVNKAQEGKYAEKREMREVQDSVKGVTQNWNLAAGDIKKIQTEMKSRCGDESQLKDKINCEQLTADVTNTVGQLEQVVKR